MTNANASLTVVGSGIKFYAHLTQETLAYLRDSDKLLYLVNEPAMASWLESTNAHAENLEALYYKYTHRPDAYAAITQHILETLATPCHLCVLLYGHPTVFANPALNAVKQAKAQGYPTQILPGISAEDCLFADLHIDPGSCGCQSFDATDFLLSKRKVDCNSHLILWQANIIGGLCHAAKHSNQKGIHLLKTYLSNFYKATHTIVIYEAAQYPRFKATITEIQLQQLNAATLSGISTLYIPPAGISHYDNEMRLALGLTAR